MFPRQRGMAFPWAIIGQASTSMMDWVASRLHKAGAALWPLLLDGEEVECLSLLSLCVG
jgi:hypothetical protein